ncbi:hypothetical protein Rctr85_069 [Virus Rctr85]|nr:hypothetical protein Rctr85_069 [Virus Rctr85]
MNIVRVKLNRDLTAEMLFPKGGGGDWSTIPAGTKGLLQDINSVFAIVHFDNLPHAWAVSQEWIDLIPAIQPRTQDIVQDMIDLVEQVADNYGHWTAIWALAEGLESANYIRAGQWLREWLGERDESGLPVYLFYACYGNGGDDNASDYPYVARMTDPIRLDQDNGEPCWPDTWPTSGPFNTYEDAWEEAKRFAATHTRSSQSTEEN